MSKNVAYTADFDIRADFTVPLFVSSDSDIKFGDTATMSLANLVASHINRVYETVPTKVGAATVRLDRAYGSAPIQEFTKEKVANGYIYSARFNVAWEIFGATIDASRRIDKDKSALDEIRRDLEWELSSDFNTNNILFVTDYDAPKVSVKISDIEITDTELDEFERNIIATVRYNLGADFYGNGKLDFYDWYGELSRNHGTPTVKQLKFIAEIEEDTGETFRGFTKEAATKFISDYVDNRESYDDYMGDCLNY